MNKYLKHIFTPHHTNNHRPKLLHPVGIAFLIGLILVISSAIEIFKTVSPKGFVLGYASNITIEQVLELTNQERTNTGLQPLTLNPQLSAAAVEKANHMFSNNYWDHISPDGTTPWFFIKGQGYRYSVAGENLARDFDSSTPMVKAWMESPTHKANIIHNKFTDTGIAVVNGQLDGFETTLVVQMFGQPTTVVTSLTQTDGQQQQPTTPQIASGEESNPQPAYQPQTAQVLSESQVGEQFIISPLSLRKSIGLTVLLTLALVLVIDELIIHKKQTIRFVGKNWAHLSFLVVIIILVVTATGPGGIL